MFGCVVLWFVLAIVSFLSAILKLPVGPGFEGVHLHPLVIRVGLTTRVRTDRGQNEAVLNYNHFQIRFVWLFFFFLIM